MYVHPLYPEGVYAPDGVIAACVRGREGQECSGNGYVSDDNQVQQPVSVIGIRGKAVAAPLIWLIHDSGEQHTVHAEGAAAVQMMAKLEGLFLDPVYTGKAFAGLIALAREGAFRPDDSVLFVHTGGAGGLFAVEM